jgi:hypothetical protein
MSRAGVILATCVVYVALGATAAGPASANWFIGSEELTSTAAIATPAKVDAALTLTVPSVGAKLSCSGSTVSATEPVVVEEFIEASSLQLTGCETTEPKTGCELEPSSKGTIVTNPVTIAAGPTATSPAGQAEIGPLNANLLAEIPFSETNTCALAGSQPLRGFALLNTPTLQELQTAQALEALGSTENNSLEIGSGNKAYITSDKLLLALTSGKAFDISGILTVRPKMLNFGNVAKGGNKKLSISIVETSPTGEVAVTSIAVEGGRTPEVFSSADTCPRAATLKLKCSATVTFTPNKNAPPVKDYYSKLVIKYITGTQSLKISVRLTGENKT